MARGTLSSGVSLTLDVFPYAFWFVLTNVCGCVHIPTVFPETHGTFISKAALVQSNFIVPLGK